MGVKTQKCMCCGKEKPATRDYYLNKSSLYNVPRMLICKDCMQDYYDKLMAKYDGDINTSFLHYCLTFDLYYDEKLLNSCIEQFGDKFLGKYLMKVNCNKEFKDKSGINNKLLPNSKVKSVEVDDGVIEQGLIFKFGEGFTAKEYAKMENRYQDFMKHYPSERLQEKELIVSLCIWYTIRDRNVVKGDRVGIKDATTQIGKLMDDLNVLPSKSKIGEDEDLNLGSLIEIIQKNDPIPEPDPIFLDVNGIEKTWNYFNDGWKRTVSMETSEVTIPDEVHT